MAEWPLLEWLLIISAGFVGGLLNAVAGGGSFFTLPALIFAGLPPAMANATGTAALLPGYLASAWRFRRDIRFPASLSLAQALLIALAGGTLGGAILLWSSDSLFRALIPWLVLFATLAFLLGPALLHRQTGSGQRPANRPTATLVLLAVCAYGGYFNGGMGILLLAAFSLLGQTDLRGMNGSKNLLSALLTAIAVTIYAIGGLVALDDLLLMAVAAIAGGWAGAALAYRLSQRVLRWIVTASGLLLFLAFLLLEF